MNTHNTPSANDMADELHPHVTIGIELATDLMIRERSAREIRSAVRAAEITVDESGQEILSRIMALSDSVILDVFELLASRSVEDLVEEDKPKESQNSGRALVRTTELIPALMNLTAAEAATEIEKFDDDFRSAILPDLYVAVGEERFSKIVASLMPVTKQSLTAGQLSIGNTANLCTFPPDEVVNLIRQQVIADRNRWNENISENSYMRDDKNYTYAIIILKAVVDDHARANEIIALLGEKMVRNIIKRSKDSSEDAVSEAFAELSVYFDDFDWESVNDLRMEMMSKRNELKEQEKLRAEKAAPAPKVSIDKEIDLDNI